MVDLIAVWIGVFLTLAIYSILYKESPWYRVAESVYLGVAVGYTVSQDLVYVRGQWETGGWSVPGVWLGGFAVALILGVLWYMRFTKKYFYIYRWPLAVVVGTGLGLTLRTVVVAQFTIQILAQAKLVLWNPSNYLTMANNILLFIMVPAVLIYFWFTGVKIRETTGMKVVDKIARYTMMAGFGASFGYTILTRYSLFIGRSQYLLGITPNPSENFAAFVVLGVVILLSMIGYDYMKRGKPPAEAAPAAPTTPAPAA